MKKELKEYFLVEELKTIKNLCDTALLAIENKRRDLLPTILEVLYEQAQTVVDEQCIMEQLNSDKP